MRWTYPGVRLAVPMDTFVFCSAERMASIEQCFSVSATRSAKKEQKNLKLISFVFNIRQFDVLYTLGSKLDTFLRTELSQKNSRTKPFNSIGSLHYILCIPIYTMDNFMSFHVPSHTPYRWKS